MAFLYTCNNLTNSFFASDITLGGATLRLRIGLPWSSAVSEGLFGMQPNICNASYIVVSKIPQRSKN